MNKSAELLNQINIWLFEKKPISKLSALMDLILSATPTNINISHRNRKINLYKGQLIITDKDLAFRWGWSRNKVRSFLKQLQKDSIIHISRNNFRTTITIKNYMKFSQPTNQLFNLINKQQIAHQFEQQTEQRVEQHINKNIKELSQPSVLQIERCNEYIEDPLKVLDETNQLTLQL